MPGTRVALEVGSYAVDPALLIVASTLISVSTVCLTVIILVLSVERSDRVEAIRALAPVLLLTRAARNWRNERGARSRHRTGRQVAARHGSDTPLVDGSCPLGTVPKRTSVRKTVQRTKSTRP